MRLVVVGGSDAGISAALRARELAPETDVTVLVADRFPNFSEATSIDPVSRSVHVVGAGGKEDVGYDELVIATGAA